MTFVFYSVEGDKKDRRSLTEKPHEFHMSTCASSVFLEHFLCDLHDAMCAYMCNFHDIIICERCFHISSHIAHVTFCDHTCDNVLHVIP